MALANNLSEVPGLGTALMLLSSRTTSTIPCRLKSFVIDEDHADWEDYEDCEEDEGNDHVVVDYNNDFLSWHKTKTSLFVSFNVVHQHLLSQCPGFDQIVIMKMIRIESKKLRLRL